MEKELNNDEGQWEVAAYSSTTYFPYNWFPSEPWVSDNEVPQTQPE
jgi:hypothetical protein